MFNLCHPELVEGLPLPLFKSGIFFVDHIKPSLSSHNLTINTSFLYRSPYFHDLSF